MSLEVFRLSAALGAEITNVDLAKVTDAEVEEIRNLLNENKVIFFPGQKISMDEHVDFGSKFGELEGHPNLKKNNSVSHPKVFELVASEGGIADEWHTDITFQDQPALMSVLHMVKCPEIGGDTMWSSLSAAYDALSEPLKDLCDGLTALHDARPHGKPEKTAIHPVVRTHPETGKKILYVNEHFTRFTVRYNWTEGTIAMWDNRSTQHYVVNDFKDERIIQRVTIMGDVVEASSNPRWEPALREGFSAVTTHDKQLITHLKEKGRS